VAEGEGIRGDGGEDKGKDGVGHRTSRTGRTDCRSRGEDDLELGGMDFEGAFGPDEIIGLSDFLVDGELGLKALLDLVSGPAAGKEALALGGSGAGDANGSVEFLFGVSFEKERND